MPVHFIIEGNRMKITLFVHHVIITQIWFLMQVEISYHMFVLI